MICRNCSTKNNKKDIFCSYCGERLNKNKNILIKIIILISVALFLGGGYLLLNKKFFNNDVSINGIDINGNYEMKDGTYIFKVNDSVIIEPSIESRNDNIDLIYELSNEDAATLDKSKNGCRIVGLKEEKSNLNIYDGDRVLKVIKISFKDDNVENNKIDTSNNSQISEQNNDTNNSYSQEYINENSIETIPTEEIDYAMSSYLYDYQDASNYGDFSIVSQDVTSDGEYYKNLQKYITNTYSKGIKIELKDYSRGNIKKIANNVYKVTYTIDWEIYNPQKDTLRQQKEQADYIFKMREGRYKLDHYENWKIIS